MWPPKFLVLLLFSSAAADRESVVIRTVAFIDSISTSVMLTVNVCWTRNDRTKLWKALSHRYPINYLTEMTKQSTQSNHLLIADLSCSESLVELRKAEARGMFKYPTKWLLYGNTSQLSDFYFRIDSQVYILNPQSEEISTIYKLSEKSLNFLQTPISKHADFSILNRMDLMGTIINVSYVLTNPTDSLKHLTDSRNPHVDAISKVSYFLVNNLLDLMNASRRFILQTSWGYRNVTTGLFGGMVGDLQTGLAQLGGTGLFFTSDRLPVIEYFSTSARTYVKFIFKAPPLSYVTNVFTLPFDTSVWHYCFVMVVIVVVCTYFIAYWEWKNVHFKEKHSDSLRPNFFDVVMMEIGAITQQGSDVEPKSYSGRIITIFSFLTLMFLYTSYSANIVALLQSTTNSIRTLEDLLNSRMQLGVEDIVYGHYYFENAKEPVRKAIYEQKVAPKGQKPRYLKADEGIRKVQKGSFAFHTEMHTAYKLIGDLFHEGEKCSLKEIAYVNVFEPFLAMQRNSSYRELMKIGMRKMTEFGIQDREYRKIYKRKPQCTSRGSNFGSVGIIDCYSAFLIFGIGIALALLLFLSEILANFMHVIFYKEQFQQQCTLKQNTTNYTT